MKRHLLTGWLAAVVVIGSSASHAATTLSMWHEAVHQGSVGQFGGRLMSYADLVARIVGDFNAIQDDVFVELKAPPLPDGQSYARSVVQAAVRGDLPDIISVETGVVAHWVKAGYLAPFDLPADVTSDLLPGALARFGGRVYGASPWITVLGLATLRSSLERSRLRTPTLTEPWNREEFDAALTAIADSRRFDLPLDLGLDNSAGWYATALRPFLANFGASLTGADNGLDSAAAIGFGEWLKDLVERGLVSGGNDDFYDITFGRLGDSYAMGWFDNVSVSSEIAREFPGDLVILPPPDVGDGGRSTATTAFMIAASATGSHRDSVVAFITFAMQPRYQALEAGFYNDIPATRAVAEDLFDPDGPMMSYVDLAGRLGGPTPVSPAHPFAAEKFGEAVEAIVRGADVTETFTAAAEAIAGHIEANGYAPLE